MASVLTTAEYRALVENSPVMIWRSGTDALCDYFNDTWLEFTGRTLQQEMGNGWAEGVHPDDLNPCVELYLDRFARRQSFEMEYRLRRHDGVYRYIFDRGTPFFADDGAFLGFIGSCVDVDDRRRAQTEREQKHRQEVQSAEQFEKWVVEIVSHDIRDPLGVVDFAAHSLLKNAGDPEAVKRAAGRATRGVERIKNIVGDLLDLSRARHGGMPMTMGPVELHRICAKCWTTSARAARRALRRVATPVVSAEHPRAISAFCRPSCRRTRQRSTDRRNCTSVEVHRREVLRSTSDIPRDRHAGRQSTRG